MDECAILHSDMNSFYASVEVMLDPSLKGKAVAVCGSVEERHGIVLAKSDLAKKAGVKTGIAKARAADVRAGVFAGRDSKPKGSKLRSKFRGA